MPQTILQSAIWPGVIAVESCEYICSHGITPGRATIVTYPQTAAPLEFGTLAFSDGTRSVAIRDCKLESIKSSLTSQGTSFTLEIVDRRWRWQYGGISGNYNQKDENGKLVPYTIRSPQELAALLLAEMGETNPFVILPPGLPKQAGADLNRYLRLGQNYPQTLTNPEQVWDHTNPAQALARLCERWGCRVVYQPVMDRVLITPLGVGRAFPNVPCEVISPNVSAPPAPAYVAAFSEEPVRYQIRFQTEAVGREWDGSYLPIDQLSYAPASNTNAKQISEVYELLSGTGFALGVRLSWTSPFTGNDLSQLYPASSGGTTLNKLDSIAAQINADSDANKVVVAVRTTPTVLRITAIGKNSTFGVDSSVNPDGSAQWANTRLISGGGDSKNTWANSYPPLFQGVQATDRLSILDAQQLAQDSVLKCFRITIIDPATGFPFVLPLAGGIARRQQFVLQDTKVDQVVPSPRIAGAINKANPAGALVPGVIPGGGVLPEFYNGYSRAQKATAAGSVWKMLAATSVFYWIDPAAKKADENTGANDRVWIDFEVNAKEQLFKFSSAVYRYNKGAANMAYIEVPKLTFETSAYVLDGITNQFIKWEEQLRILNGTGPTEWTQLDDMKVGIIWRYQPGSNKFLSQTIDGGQDATQRAGYYLRGIGTKYQIKGGEIRRAIGIYPFDPDGYCQQVSYSVGSGATTTFSGNTEFDAWTTPYPARRRPENLPPNQSAALANLAERRGWDRNKGTAPK